MRDKKTREIIIIIIIESCTQRKENIINIMEQRSAPSNK